MKVEAEMKRTDWFPGTVKPVRVGWYEVRSDVARVIDRDYWNGVHWCWGFGDCLIQYLPSEQDILPWRGLTEKAK